MFLKNKWKNLSIKKKLFIWSSLIIIIAFTLLYICIYFFMPRVYEFYKVNSVKSGIEELKSQLGSDEDIDIDELLDSFSYKNNIDCFINCNTGYSSLAFPQKKSATVPGPV